MKKNDIDVTANIAIIAGDTFVEVAVATATTT